MNDKGIVLIGGGGHCKSVLDSVLKAKNFLSVVITDQDALIPKSILNCSIVGNDSRLCDLFQDGYTNAALTVGSLESTKIRRGIYDRVKNIGFIFPSLVDVSASVSDFSRIGQGTYVGKQAVINADADVGEFVIVNTSAVIEHDCKIGDFSHIAVGAVVCGGADIGRDVFIGAHATVIQGVKVGMNSSIGAGSIVLADVPENRRVLGIWGGYRLRVRRRRDFVGVACCLCFRTDEVAA